MKINLNTLKAYFDHISTNPYRSFIECYSFNPEIFQAALDKLASMDVIIILLIKHDYEVFGE